MYDVYVTVRVRVNASNQERAEFHALDAMEIAVGDLSGKPGIVECGILLSTLNPKTVEVKP